MALDESILSACAGYNFYGLNRGEHEGKTGIWYREWAPGARVEPLHTLSCQDVTQCRRAVLHRHHVHAGALTYTC